MRHWFLALCLLGSLTARAQSPVWALQGAHNTVYLAESVHLLKPGDAKLPAAVTRAYDDSTQLVMEMDLGEARHQQHVHVDDGTWPLSGR